MTPSAEPSQTHVVPERELQIPVVEIGPSPDPEGAADENADRAPEPGIDRREPAEPVDPERANRIGDGVAEILVFVLPVLDRLALRRVDGRQDDPTMHREHQRGAEEARHRQHVRRVVVEVEALIADIGYPIEMGEDAVGKAMAPRAEHDRAEHLEAEIGKDREGEGDRDVKTHPQLARDFHLSERPRDEGPGSADGDDLPQAAFAQGREAEAVFDRGRGDVDLPDIPRRPDRRAVDDQGGTQRGEDCGGDAEEPYEERSDPEIEHLPAYQRPPGDAVLPLETEHRHEAPPISMSTMMDTMICPDGLPLQEI